MPQKNDDPFEGLSLMGTGSSFVLEIADMLERADMFRDMSRQEVELFAAYVQAYEAPVGAMVLIEGSREPYMFVVAQGKLDILKRSGDYKQSKRIATVRAGKTVGEMSLLDGLPHSASAKVVDAPANLLCVTRHNFDTFLTCQPEAALKLMRKMAALMSLRLRQTSGVLIDHL